MSQSNDAFAAYQTELRDRVDNRPEVIGLVFLGSSAALHRVDQHSDHDFFLVVKPGFGEQYRKNLDWLPQHQEILLAPRETAHGLKVVYKDLRLLEFAVFEDQELELAAANDFAVVLDKADIAPRMEAIAKRSVPRKFDAEAEFELFLALVQIGVGRFRRGEKIAAEQHLKIYAVEKLIRLFRHYKPLEVSSADSLNPFRRFEFDYPNIAREINQLQLQPGDTCASGLLEIALKLPITEVEKEKLHHIKKGMGL